MKTTTRLKIIMLGTAAGVLLVGCATQPAKTAAVTPAQLPTITVTHVNGNQVTEETTVIKSEKLRQPDPKMISALMNFDRTY